MYLFRPVLTSMNNSLMIDQPDWAEKISTKVKKGPDSTKLALKNFVHKLAVGTN